jgi:dolichol-phosphate mannosyltransferase
LCINLAIVCPVFNEEKNIQAVLEEWVRALDEVVGHDQYHFIFFNDGSTDQTLNKLKDLASKFLQMVLVNKPNSGHGPTCIYGYEYVIQKKYSWVFQIDSDGQCDPIYFKQFWQNKEKHPWQFGQRKTRDDGWQRIVVTNILACAVFLGSGVFVKDANVPYRLMPVQKLPEIIKHIPKNFFLANVVLSVFIQARFKITWYPIHFRARFSGESKVKGFKFAKIGLRLFFDLWKMRPLFNSKD